LLGGFLVFVGFGVGLRVAGRLVVSGVGSGAVVDSAAGGGVPRRKQWAGCNALAGVDGVAGGGVWPHASRGGGPSRTGLFPPRPGTHIGERAGRAVEGVFVSRLVLGNQYRLDGAIGRGGNARAAVGP